MPVSAAGDGLEFSIDKVYNTTDAVASIGIADGIVRIHFHNVCEFTHIAKLAAAFCHYGNVTINTLLCDMQSGKRIKANVNCVNVFIVDIHINFLNYEGCFLSTIALNSSSYHRNYICL